jgi:hypothetical protein
MRDEELSGEEGSEDDDRALAAASESEDEDEFANETVDEARLRLAKKYLDTVKQETEAAEDEVCVCVSDVGQEQGNGRMHAAAENAYPCRARSPKAPWLGVRCRMQVAWGIMRTELAPSCRTML